MRCLAILIVCLFAGVLSAQPEIDVQRGGVSIASGTTDSVTNPGTSPFNLSYTIRNDGTTALSLTSMPEVVISGETNCTVVVLTAPSTPVAAGGTTQFILQVTPLSATDFEFDISIPNDDSNENPYLIHFDAKPVSPPAKTSSSSKGGGNCSTNEISGTSLWLLLIAGVLCHLALSRRGSFD
ncbi:MAG: hypothetical protein KDB90_16440 [Planctomycetes bacterium]|nr:hypothetical protein [Planctomycetota bacterium]